MSCTKSGKWQLLFYSSFLCVALTFFFLLLHFNVSVVLLFSSYDWCVYLCFSLWPGFISLNRLMTFEQRYNTVAFIPDLFMLYRKHLEVKRLILNIDLLITSRMFRQHTKIDKRRVPHGDQDLLTLPENLRSSPSVWWGSWWLVFSLLCYVFCTIIRLFVFLF